MLLLFIARYYLLLISVFEQLFRVFVLGVIIQTSITYLMTCSTAVTQMYSRNSLRHFFSNEHSSQTDFI